MPDTTRESRPVALIGPSGCGKSSVLKLLVEQRLVHVTPTWTDRPKRNGEEELEHHFVSNVELSRRAERGEFAEVVQPFGLPYRYGLPILETAPGRVPVVLIRAAFVAKFRKYYPRSLIYQIEADFAFARDAVLARSQDGHGTRLNDFDAEVQAGRQLADRSFHNDGKDLAQLAEMLKAAMRQDGLL